MKRQGPRDQPTVAPALRREPPLPVDHLGIEIGSFLLNGMAN